VLLSKDENDITILTIKILKKLNYLRLIRALNNSSCWT